MVDLLSIFRASMEGRINLAMRIASDPKTSREESLEAMVALSTMTITLKNFDDLFENYDASPLK